MARTRSINPDVWTDESVQSLPWSAVGFYLGTISMADDYGRLEWSAKQLGGRICGLRDDVTTADVVGFMDALIAAELIKTYEIDGKTYAHHPNWRKYQYVNRPAKGLIPPPPSAHTPGVGTEDARRMHGGCTESPVPLESESESKSDMDSELRVLRSAFGSTEDDVAAFLAMVAEKNRTGKITMGREITLRTELLEILKVRLSGVHGALSYGINAAIKKSADSTGYVREAGLTWLRQPRNLASVQTAKPRSAGQDLSKVL